MSLRWSLHAWFFCAALLCTGAYGQTPAPSSAQRDKKIDGRWVLQHFGVGDRLDEPEARRFARTRKLSQIDSSGRWPESDPQVSLEDFAAAWGHLSRQLVGQVDLEDTDFESQRASAAFLSLGPDGGQSGFLEEGDFSGDDWIGSALRDSADEFVRMLGGNGPWSAAEVDRALTAEGARKHPSKLARLTNYLVNGRISRGAFRSFSSADLLYQLDRDKNGTIDRLEYATGAPKERVLTPFDAAKAWIALSGGSGIPVGTDLSPKALEGEGRGDGWRLAAAGDAIGQEWWRKHIGVIDRLVRLEVFEDLWTKPEATRFQSGNGILLYPKPILIDEASSYASEKPSLWLRFAKDYEVLDDNLAPATFTWTKSNGRSSFQTDASIAIQRRAARSQSSLMVAFRRTAFDTSDPARESEELEQNRYFAGGFYHLNGKSESLLTSQFFRAGGTHFEDRGRGAKRDSLELEWFPIFNPSLLLPRSGSYVAFTALGRELKWYWQPSVGVDWGRTDPADGDADTSGFVDLTLSLGLKLAKRFTVQSQLHAYADVEELNRSFGYHETTISWTLDKSKSVSLVGSATNGRPAPLFQDVEQYMIGVGVKF